MIRASDMAHRRKLMDEAEACATSAASLVPIEILRGKLSKYWNAGVIDRATFSDMRAALSELEGLREQVESLLQDEQIETQSLRAAGLLPGEEGGSPTAHSASDAGLDGRE